MSIVTDSIRSDSQYKQLLAALGDSKAAGEGLRAAHGMLRRHLAMTLNLRLTPELLFYADGSIEHGARIARILDEIGVTKETDTSEGSENDDE